MSETRFPGSYWYKHNEYQQHAIQLPPKSKKPPQVLPCRRRKKCPDPAGINLESRVAPLLKFLFIYCVHTLFPLPQISLPFFFFFSLIFPLTLKNLNLISFSKESEINSNYPSSCIPLPNQKTPTPISEACYKQTASFPEDFCKV